MGCFSCVCIVSKLPIYGHPVIGIPIKKNPHPSRVRCYPNADWEIDGFPFFGNNDDYGRIEDYEEGPYNALNEKRYGPELKDEDHDKNLMNQWCQPEGNQSIMFIHRPVWDELMNLHREDAVRHYARSMEYTETDSNRFIKMSAKHLPEEKRQEYLNKCLKIVPYFRGETVGFSDKFLEWCQENYTDSVKEGLIDLLAFSSSCNFTHTLFMPTYTVGEQISGWSYESEWHLFIAHFAKKTRAKFVEEGWEE